MQQDAYTDRVAVQNAEADLYDAGRDLEQARAKADPDLNYAVSQIYDAEADARTAEAQRRYDCRSASTSSCSVARRNEDAARTSVTTARRHAEVARAQGRQAITAAQGQVTKSESAVKTALATLKSNEAKASGTMTEAVAKVNDAQNAVEVALAAVEKESAGQLGTLVKSQNDVEAAQASLNSSLARSQSSLVEVQNEAHEAGANLSAAQASLADAEVVVAAAVEKARAQVDAARQELASATAASRAPDAAPAVDQADVRSAQAQIDAAKAALQGAHDALRAATLVAPKSGTVASINAVVGQSITAGDGAGVLTVTDHSMANVTARVSGADVGRVAPGQKVMFSVDDMPGRTFTGTMNRIDPAAPGVANAVSHNVVSTVDPANDVILPTMNATVSIIVDRAVNVTLIPNAALAFDAQPAQAPPASTGQPVDAGRTGRIVHALILADGEPSLRQILVGTSDENNTQVISGLEPGEQVIVGQIVTGPGQNPTQTK